MFNVPLNNVLAYKTINRTKTRIKPVHTSKAYKEATIHMLGI